ncbi:hypothetical protein BDZ45DRAFT_140629 [Acephala macrosclerotiorum]|nr:hypothetical protein BDZ45DRAFT_140629 [Acephala macrosclerotiorum]
MTLKTGILVLTARATVAASALSQERASRAASPPPFFEVRLNSSYHTTPLSSSCKAFVLKHFIDHGTFPIPHSKLHHAFLSFHLYCVLRAPKPFN